MGNSVSRKIREVPQGYLVIGVDPHKKKHAGVIITQDFTVLAKLKFDNTKQGIEMMIERARWEMVKSGTRGIIFAIETGGHYWRNIAYILDEQQILFHFINQFTLKRRREGKDLNRRKNDYTDSETAAQLLCTGEFVESNLPQGVYAELRAGYNAYCRLVKEKTRLTNLLKGLLDGLFPEFTRIFKDPCGVTALSVLSTCAIPGFIAGMSEDEFLATIKARLEKHMRWKKLKALYCVAKTSIGIPAGSRLVSREIALLVDKYKLIRQHIRELESELVKLVDATEEGQYLLSVKGLNYIAVAGLLAELGCFKAYRSAKQMIKMAGSNPTEKESAGKKRSHTPMSKKGRPILRYCAWTSVIPLLRFNLDFREWAKQRRERPAYANPLSGRELLGAAINKLFRLAYALVRNHTYYRVSKPESILVTA
jgi:transposase